MERTVETEKKSCFISINFPLQQTRLQSHPIYLILSPSLSSTSLLLLNNYKLLNSTAVNFLCTFFGAFFSPLTLLRSLLLFYDVK